MLVFKTIILEHFNVHSKIFTNLLLPVNSNLQETCIPSPSPRLTGFPVITTSLYSSPLKKLKIVLAKLRDFPSGKYRLRTCLPDYLVVFPVRSYFRNPNKGISFIVDLVSELFVVIIGNSLVVAANSFSTTSTFLDLLSKLFLTTCNKH